MKESLRKKSIGQEKEIKAYKANYLFQFLLSPVSRPLLDSIKVWGFGNFGCLHYEPIHYQIYTIYA